MLISSPLTCAVFIAAVAATGAAWLYAHPTHSRPARTAAPRRSANSNPRRLETGFFFLNKSATTPGTGRRRCLYCADFVREYTPRCLPSIIWTAVFPAGSIFAESQRPAGISNFDESLDAMKPSRWSNVLRRVTTAGPYVNERLSILVLTLVCDCGDLRCHLCGPIRRFAFTGPPCTSCH